MDVTSEAIGCLLQFKVFGWFKLLTKKHGIYTGTICFVRDGMLIL